MVFLRPGMGFFAGLILTRLIKRPNAPLTRVLKLGSYIYVGAWCALTVVSELPLSMDFDFTGGDDGGGATTVLPLLKPAVICQLAFQSSSFFMIMIPANAIIVARVPEADLSSTVAVVQMQQRVGQVISAASMLAIINAVGNIQTVSSYRPVWYLIVALALVTCAVCSLVPTDFKKSSGGYTRIDVEEQEQEQQADEEERSGLLLGTTSAGVGGRGSSGSEEEEEEEERERDTAGEGGDDRRRDSPTTPTSSSSSIYAHGNGRDHRHDAE